MARRLIVLAASCGALAPRAPVKPTQFFRGRFDGTQFRTEPLEAATFDEFSTDEGAAAPGNPQLFTADGAPLMTAPCCIKVVGVGGGGGNAVNRMVETDAGSFVDFWAMNTDAQARLGVRASSRVSLRWRLPERRRWVVFFRISSAFW